MSQSRGSRHLLRDYCKYAYYTGVGDYWYEPLYHETIPYKAYQIISFTIYTAMVLLENFAALFGDFPDVEKNSAVMFAATHSIVLTKMYLLMYHKRSIRRLNLEMSDVGESFEEGPVMMKQYKKAKVGISLFVASVYAALLAYGIESLRKTIVEGSPFYTVVTYYPQYEDSSSAAGVIRVFFLCTWSCMMLPMIAADCFPITHVIITAFKFITLRHHFHKIRSNFDTNVLVKRRDEAIGELKAGFLEGILMHQKLLSLSEEIHRVFSIIMSLQVCESSAVAVLLLLRLAQAPNLDVTNALMTYTFVGSLFLLLALNLWNAGDLTYEASLLSAAMFDCGWHLSAPHTPAHADVRRLVLVASAQAQRPLVLKAFGIQDLSYETFVSVAKATYSVFAVFYESGN